MRGTGATPQIFRTNFLFTTFYTALGWVTVIGVTSYEYMFSKPSLSMSRISHPPMMALGPRMAL